MYAVIQTGGKQYRVAQGDRLDVEWPASALADTTVIDTPGTGEATVRLIHPDLPGRAAGVPTRPTASTSSSPSRMQSMNASM